MKLDRPLVGDHLNRLEIVKIYSAQGRRVAQCRCDCGNTTVVRLSRVTSGKTRSCGCLAAQLAGERLKENHVAFKHGACVGEKPTPEYVVWAGMVQRATNPSHAGAENYVGRGICICERWRSFELFLADMGPRPTGKHTIERRDNDGPYSPENCYWATRREQSLNTRRSRVLTVNGEAMPAFKWAERIGMKYQSFMMRLRRGWTPEQAVAGTR